MSAHDTTKGIYWLASYPKSGNTWFRIVLANLTADKNVSINQVTTGNIASSRVWIEDALGFDSTYLTHDELDALRPAIYTWLSDQMQGFEYHKIHDAYTYLDSNEPLIPAEGCLGALYFIRNPLDVTISYAHHSSRSVDDIITEMGQSEAAFCKNRFRHNLQIRQWLRSWSMHVQSWTENTNIPVCTLRYEDMHLNTMDTFMRAFNFLRIHPSSERLAKALDHARIDKLQQQESNEGFREKPSGMERFFRKGMIGDWQNTLTQEQINRIIQNHREVMEKFGYLHSDGTPKTH